MTSSLVEENRALRERIAFLEKEVEFLRLHPTIAQGMKGVMLVVNETGGVPGAYADEHDVVLNQTVRIEVKFSKLNAPDPRGTTRRWNWSKPLGWKDKGKAYDYLLLVGEKDLRFSNQYLDNEPYVFFLVPKSEVAAIMTSGAAIGGNVQIITNLARVKSPASLALRRRMVPWSAINQLLENTAAVQKAVRQGGVAPVAPDTSAHAWLGEPALTKPTPATAS